ncbi:3'(2'),5'-bisphosphate nucleotidase 1 [Centruroides vittatus]|uniref:3'(2'),5'-bisphosphate nucleotidase 1 n=1 Tax=Centruroides vittatus TaxID=120091 RepID=UPI00351028DE
MAATTANCSPLLMRLLSASVAVANRAGKIIRDIMSHGDLGIVEKGVNDLQTEADRSVQRCIVTSLSRQFPKVSIIGEEVLDPQETLDEEWVVSTLDKDVLSVKCPQDLQAVKEEEVVVWVDPLDGTSEYTQGLLDHVTILIGVAVNGKAVGGVIHQPYYNYQIEKDPTKLGRTMWGVLGVGAFGIERKDPPEGNVITTTRSHSNAAINSCLEALKPDSILRVGGAGHKVILLIEGKAHAYVFPSPGCKKWDTCAPEALLHAIGGKLTDVHGNPFEYHGKVEHVNSAGVLATCSAGIHEWYRSRIPEDVYVKLNPGRFVPLLF